MSGAGPDRGPGRPRRSDVYFQPPPCEHQWMVIYGPDGEPRGLLIDGRCYRVTPLKGQSGVRPGDSHVEVVFTRPPTD